jgi:hypothetical protein
VFATKTVKVKAENLDFVNYERANKLDCVVKANPRGEHLKGDPLG